MQDAPQVATALEPSRTQAFGLALSFYVYLPNKLTLVTALRRVIKLFMKLLLLIMHVLRCAPGSHRSKARSTL